MQILHATSSVGAATTKGKKSLWSHVIEKKKFESTPYGEKD
jgi:hypothetical protein